MFALVQWKLWDHRLKCFIQALNDFSFHAHLLLVDCCGAEPTQTSYTQSKVVDLAFESWDAQESGLVIRAQLACVALIADVLPKLIAGSFNHRCQNVYISA